MLSPTAICVRRAIVSIVCAFALVVPPSEVRAQELVERIVAVVDDDPILLSEVDRALLLGIMQTEEGEEEEMARRRTLDWLVEQRLRFHEVERYGFSSVPDSVIDQQVNAIRLGMGSDELFREQLEMLGIDEQGLRQMLARQLQVVTFVEERLGLRIFVSLSDIEGYYRNVVVPELEEAAQPIPPVEDLREPIRAVLKEERLNLELERWTDDLRAEAEILDFFEEKARDFPPLVLTLEEEPEP